jgi:hypothetical protein
MDEGQDAKVDRLWLTGNLLAWIPISAVIMASIERNAGGIRTSELPTIAAVAAVWGTMLTFFFVSIPSRIVVNLAIEGRRTRRRWETLLCAVTFVILCWAAYAFMTAHFP